MIKWYLQITPVLSSKSNFLAKCNRRGCFIKYLTQISSPLFSSKYQSMKNVLEPNFFQWSRWKCIIHQMIQVYELFLRFLNKNVKQCDEMLFYWHYHIINGLPLKSFVLQYIYLFDIFFDSPPFLSDSRLFTLDSRLFTLDSRPGTLDSRPGTLDSRPSTKS